MTIYSTRAKRPVRHNVQQANESAKVPTPIKPSAPEAVAIACAIRPVRNAKVVNHLLSSTIDWLASLPPNARPLALATKYPRIANRIAQEWKEPSACRRDFDDLVYDNRGNRKGFPADVHRDLLTLRDYYYGYDLALAKEA